MGFNNALAGMAYVGQGMAEQESEIARRRLNNQASDVNAQALRQMQEADRSQKEMERISKAGLSAYAPEAYTGGPMVNIQGMPKQEAQPQPQQPTPVTAGQSFPQALKDRYNAQEQLENLNAAKGRIQGDLNTIRSAPGYQSQSDNQALRNALTGPSVGQGVIGDVALAAPRLGRDAVNLAARGANAVFGTNFDTKWGSGIGNQGDSTRAARELAADPPVAKGNYLVQAENDKMSRMKGIDAQIKQATSQRDAAAAKGQTGSFDSAVAALLKAEGGFNAKDPRTGQPVNMGIDQKAHPGVDVSKLTPDQVKRIYFEEYWKPMGLPADVDPKLAEIALSASVITGKPGRVRQWIDQSGGDPSKVLGMYSQYLGKIVQSDPNSAQYASGWGNRINTLAQGLQGQQPAAPGVASAAPGQPQAAPAQAQAQAQQTPQPQLTPGQYQLSGSIQSPEAAIRSQEMERWRQIALNTTGQAHNAAMQQYQALRMQDAGDQIMRMGYAASMGDVSALQRMVGMYGQNSGMQLGATIQNGQAFVYNNQGQVIAQGTPDKIARTLMEGLNSDLRKRQLDNADFAWKENVKALATLPVEREKAIAHFQQAMATAQVTGQYNVLAKEAEALYKGGQLHGMASPNGDIVLYTPNGAQVGFLRPGQPDPKRPGLMTDPQFQPANVQLAGR